MVETKDCIVFVSNVMIIFVMIMIQIEMMKLVGVVLFQNYYITKISMSNMDMQFGYSFQVNVGLGVYQV